MCHVKFGFTFHWPPFFKKSPATTVKPTVRPFCVTQAATPASPTALPFRCNASCAGPAITEPDEVNNHHTTNNILKYSHLKKPQMKTKQERIRTTAGKCPPRDCQLAASKHDAPRHISLGCQHVHMHSTGPVLKNNHSASHTNCSKSNAFKIANGLKSAASFLRIISSSPMSNLSRTSTAAPAQRSPQDVAQQTYPRSAQWILSVPVMWTSMSSKYLSQKTETVFVQSKDQWHPGAVAL